jgi:hypothetical protein
MMHVVNNIEHIYPEETLRYCNWERFSEKAVDCVFFNAGPQNIEIPQPVPKYLLYFEEQTWDRDTTDLCVPHVDKIFTILNPNISGRHQKRHSVFYPTNETITEQAREGTEKKYDVIYTGFAGGNHVQKILNSIVKFNYRWVSFGNNPLATDRNINYIQKLRLISECKIDVCHGLVGNGTPQTKSRYFEAAFCKSLNLMHKDQWNCIEEWFTPNEHFIYFETEDELCDLIKDVSTNYEKYIPIVEAAYQKAMKEYTTEQFVRKYIGFKGDEQ